MYAQCDIEGRQYNLMEGVDLKESNLVEVAEYAVAKNLLDAPTFL
jgi:hypothetical protein